MPAIMDAILKAPCPPCLTISVRTSTNSDIFTSSPYFASTVCFVDRSQSAGSSSLIYLGRKWRNNISPQIKLLELSIKSFLVPTVLHFSGERLKPMEMLILHGYKWMHSADEYAKVWDFSKLQFLRLDGTPLGQFIRSVPGEDLAHLRCLHIDCHEARINGMFPNPPARFTKLLESLVNLEELDVSGLYVSSGAIQSFDILHDFTVLC